MKIISLHLLWHIDKTVKSDEEDCEVPTSKDLLLENKSNNSNFSPEANHLYLFLNLL